MWPDQLVVAKAYLDQLTRSQALPSNKIADLKKAIDKAEKSHLKPGDVNKLKDLVPYLEESAAAAKNAEDTSRLRALAELLKHPTA